MDSSSHKRQRKRSKRTIKPRRYQALHRDYEIIETIEIVIQSEYILVNNDELKKYTDTSDLSNVQVELLSKQI